MERRETVSERIDSAARTTLRANDRGGYTVPTAGLYPFQWNWDSAFVALGFADFDLDRGWNEIETLFDGQWSNGMVPHILFHQDDAGYFPGPGVWQSNTRPPSSGITQPPVVASVVRQLWDHHGGASGKHHDRMVALYGRLLAYHRWFHEFRDPLRKGLVLAVHSWETGRDNSAEWDEALAAVDVSRIRPYQRRDTSHVDPARRPSGEEYDRYVAILEFGREQGWNPEIVARHGPFQVIDIGMSMILLRANRDLRHLALMLGDNAAVAELDGRIALSEAGMEWLWSDRAGAFCSRNLRTGASSDLVTNASFLAWYAGVGTPAQRDALLKNLQKLAEECRYLLPSLAPGSRSYDPNRYWRGPVWLVINYLVSQGLAEAGFVQWAERLRADSMRLVRNAGFCESFNPETGEGTGAKDFSWTAAMWLHWAKHATLDESVPA